MWKFSKPLLVEALFPLGNLLTCYLSEPFSLRIPIGYHVKRSIIHFNPSTRISIFTSFYLNSFSDVFLANTHNVPAVFQLLKLLLKQKEEQI